jgi:hypothetical protein
MELEILAELIEETNCGKFRFDRANSFGPNGRPYLAISISNREVVHAAHEHTRAHTCIRVLHVASDSYNTRSGDVLTASRFI